MQASVPPTVKEKDLAIYGAQKIAFVLDWLILSVKYLISKNQAEWIDYSNQIFICFLMVNVK